MASSDERIQLEKLAYVHYRHPDLSKAKDFLLDFGLEALPGASTSGRVYFKGFGNQPYIYLAESSTDGHRQFVCAAWAVKSLSDLEKASRLPGATNIENAEGPGGGKVVSVTDPQGFVVRLLYGLELYKDVEHPAEVITNTAQGKTRKGEFQRFEKGPSKVHKLGHYGLVVAAPNFLPMRDWYMKTFSLVISDSVFNPQSGEDETSFMHIDRGEEFSDHHSFFLAAGPPQLPKPHIHHSSFEVHDMDTQLLGHNWLEEKGWTNCWGVGRHVLGSQIFDYWFDASGNIIEHYSDGDLVNSETKLTRAAATPSSLFIWGPNVPLAFVTGRIEDLPEQRSAKGQYQAPAVPS